MGHRKRSLTPISFVLLNLHKDPHFHSGYTRQVRSLIRTAKTQYSSLTLMTSRGSLTHANPDTTPLLNTVHQTLVGAPLGDDAHG